MPVTASGSIQASGRLARRLREMGGMCGRNRQIFCEKRPVLHEKDDPGRVHETLGISHAYPNRLNRRIGHHLAAWRSKRPKIAVSNANLLYRLLTPNRKPFSLAEVSHAKLALQLAFLDCMVLR
jgi:hypothetical protein